MCISMKQIVWVILGKIDFPQYTAGLGLIKFYMNYLKTCKKKNCDENVYYYCTTNYYTTVNKKTKKNCDENVIVHIIIQHHFF